MKKTYKNPELQVIAMRTDENLLIGFGSGTKDPATSDAPRFDFDEEGLF